MASKETQLIQAPFTIRAHHLYSYAELLRDRDPQGQAKETNLEILDGELKDSQFNESDEWVGAKYVKDVLGSTPQQVLDFERVQVIAFNNFLNLPDNFPVEITRKKDVICEGCVVGEHCLIRFRGDKRELTKFIKSMQRIIGKRIKPSTNIPTTLGIVRAVLLRPEWEPKPPSKTS